MRDHGYIEGENLVIEVRDAMGRPDRFAPLAAELVALKPDCIVVMGVEPTQAAKRATTTIPIIMGNADDDPVRRGLIASFAPPGGNVTGVMNIGADLASKRLELLRELIPGLSQAAMLWLSDVDTSTAHLRNTEAAAATIGVRIEPLPIRSAEELDDAFRKAAESRVQAIIVPAVAGHRYQECLLRPFFLTPIRRRRRADQLRWRPARAPPPGGRLRVAHLNGCQPVRSADSAARSFRACP